MDTYIIFIIIFGSLAFVFLCVFCFILPHFHTSGRVYNESPPNQTENIALGMPVDISNISTVIGVPVYPNSRNVRNVRNVQMESHTVFVTPRADRVVGGDVVEDNNV